MTENLINIAAIFLISLTISGCFSGESKNRCNTEMTKQLCTRFLYSICTKDTLNFYELVNENQLTEGINNWIKDSKPYKPDNIHFPFFFVFGPHKMRYSDLMELRKDKEYISNIRIVNSAEKDKYHSNLTIYWNERYLEEDQKLYIAIDNDCKIVNAKWDLADSN